MELFRWTGILYGFVGLAFATGNQASNEPYVENFFVGAIGLTSDGRTTQSGSLINHDMGLADSVQCLMPDGTDRYTQSQEQCCDLDGNPVGEDGYEIDCNELGD